MACHSGNILEQHQDEPHERIVTSKLDDVTGGVISLVDLSLLCGTGAGDRELVTSEGYENYTCVLNCSESRERTVRKRDDVLCTIQIC